MRVIRAGLPALLATPAVLAIPLLVAACSSPFGASDDDEAPRLPPARFQTVQPLDLDSYAAPDPDPEPVPVDAVIPPPGSPEGPKRPPSRLDNMESVSMSIEAARASALTNNIDLHVALVDPSIAGQELRAQRAKFEAIFVPRLFYAETDNPTLDVTSANQQDSLSGSVGVDIPLRTGGRASVNLEEGRSETNNPFFTFNTAYDSALAFSLSHPLLRNAGREANNYSVRIAGYQEQQARARTKLEVIRQLAAVDRSYWRLYAARRELEVRQQQYELASEQLGRAERRVRAGDVAEVEELRARSGVAERLEAIIVAENALLAQQREFKRVINLPGLDLETRTAVETSTEPAPIAYRFTDAPALANAAVANRMEMLELELQLAADAATIGFNRNQALPLLTLDYTYRIGGLGPTFTESQDVLINNDFESWTLGLSGQVPIGNEAAKARVQQAILTRLQRLSTRDARALAIRQEVLDAADRVEAGWQRILAARQAAIAAARTFLAEQRQNEVGLRTSTDVLDAAARLAESQSAEIRAISDYQIALVDLAFATGTLLGAVEVDWEPIDAPEDTGEEAPPGPDVTSYEQPDAAPATILAPTGSAAPPR
ncbi:MAG: TolC family protein [Phycisphaerales bacterium]|nr:TolC family protein [Phycisphaerales bacterium]